MIDGLRLTLERFLSLPLHLSEPVHDLFSSLPGAIRRGEGKRTFVYVPGSRPDRVLLVAHADTVWDFSYTGIALPDRNFFDFRNGFFHSANGDGVGLGADDRAGCAILWLLKDLGHSLLITDGEERGQLASRFLIDDPSNRDVAGDINENHRFAIQFDRRGGRDFKCYDVGTDEFRSYVRSKTGYSEPDRQATTDIRVLCREIAGVNLSIGYRREHGPGEHLVLAEWENTLEMCRAWLSEKDLSRFTLPPSPAPPSSS